MRDILSARLAELILQLHGLRDQLRSAVFQTVREAVLRTAGDAVDRLWRARRRPPGYPSPSSAYDPAEDRYRYGGGEIDRDHDEEDEDGDERSWAHRRAADPDPGRTRRNEALQRAIRAGLGWWLLRKCSLLRILTVGSLGLAVSVLLGPERVTPAKILELVIPAVDILSS